MLARLMRAFFYLLYQPMAWSYDAVAWLVSWGRWKDWVMSVLPYLEGPRVLELGHGPGHLQVALHQQGLPAFGLDASRQMGQQARKRISKQGHPYQLSRSYAQKLPFTNESFHQIVATFPTEYIYTQATLAEIWRALKPGGKLIVLPVAWITGKSIIDRGAAALFRVTGQAPKLAGQPGWEAQWLEPFHRAGFQAEAEMIHQKSWALVIILAQKSV
jgi:ubiquinone/menaquinone biosynthesis C-methylase UbiE